MQGELSLGTPALLFPTISLLLLAFTNRFLAVASIIRGLSQEFEKTRDAGVLAQIANLRRRLNLMRSMQAMGVISLFLCVACMFALFAGADVAARWLFGASLVLMMGSLAQSAWEIQLSTGALHIHLGSVEERCQVALTAAKAGRSSRRT